MKLKYSVILLLISIFLISSNCKDEGTAPPDPFDHLQQQELDQAKLDEYLQNHYLDTDGSIQPIENGETPLADIVETHTETYYFLDSDQEVEFKYYTYTFDEGINESPTYVDMVHAAYQVESLDGESYDRSDYGIWMDLHTTILGWRIAVPQYKSGDVIDNGDGTFSYENAGKFILILPSGMAYRETGKGEIPRNTCLTFQITLHEVFRTDYDEDGILSMNEDVDGDGKYDDDTDDDKLPNYLDDDDDGDGVLTKDEDANGNGDPTDDDSDGDGIPDYLDADTNG